MRSKANPLSILLCTFICIAIGKKIKCKNKDVATGQQQLVDILNAAFVRIVADGTFRSILVQNNVEDIILQQISDCAPFPSAIPFPAVDDLKCRALKIITNEEITFGLNGFEFTTNRTGIDITGTVDAPLFDLRDELIARINDNYDIDLTVNVYLITPFDDRTALLNDGTVDLLDPVQSLGNIDEDGTYLRSNRLFSCSIFAGSQFYLVRADSTLDTFQDLIDAGSSISICGSVIFSTITEAYLPDAQYSQLPPPPITGGDIATCIPGVANGIFDVYASLFPTAQSTKYNFAANGLDPDDFKVIEPLISNANVYWVADIDTKNF